MRIADLIRESDGDGSGKKGAKVLSALDTVQAFANQYSNLNSASAIARQLDASNSLREAIEQYEKRAKAEELTLRVPTHLPYVPDPGGSANANLQEVVQLLRRAEAANAQAIVDAKRREDEANLREVQSRREVRKAYAIAVVSALVGVGSMLLTAWPFIKDWLDSM